MILPVRKELQNLLYLILLELYCAFLALEASLAYLLLFYLVIQLCRILPLLALLYLVLLL